MLGRMSTKNLVLSAFCFSCLILCCAYAPYEPDYNKYRATVRLQDFFSDYMSDVRTNIQKSWNPPDFMEKGHVTLMFKVDRRGEIMETNIIESSGNSVYDESALDAIKKAAPFGKFPLNAPKDFITVKYSFDTSYVKTDQMKEYVSKADRFFNVDNKIALEYINLAIDEVNGDIGSYFLYGKRSKIKRALGDIKGAEEDMTECKKLKSKFDQKRILSCKIIAEMEQSPFAYYHLAYSYELAGDYIHAIEAIDKAISLTELNNGYKRYRAELVRKRQSDL